MIRHRRRLAGGIELDGDDDVISLESSPDATYRVVAMTITLAPMIILGIACITYLVLLN